MVNVLSSRKVYAGSWSEKESRAWNSEELKSVESATIVSSEFGKSICFTLINRGGKVYYPLTNDSTAGVGETVKMEDTEYVVLSKPGETDIERVRVK